MFTNCTSRSRDSCASSFRFVHLHKASESLEFVYGCLPRVFRHRNQIRCSCETTLRGSVRLRFLNRNAFELMFAEFVRDDCIQASIIDDHVSAATPANRCLR